MGRGRGYSGKRSFQRNTITTGGMVACVCTLIGLTIVFGLFLSSWLGDSAGEEDFIRDMTGADFSDWEDVVPDQDNPEFVLFVRKNYIKPPLLSKEYNLNQKNDVKPVLRPQIQAFLPLLKTIDDGFFVEVGAGEGELLSNTLWLEKELHWQGLLIEDNTDAYNALVKKNRRAWHSHACVSPEGRPVTAFRFPRYHRYQLEVANSNSRRTANTDDSNSFDYVEVECIPLYTLLLALGRSSVDFFSLRTENGSQLDILRTIPFDKITFKLLTISFKDLTVGSGRGHGDSQLEVFMKSKGYIQYSRVIGDLLYVHSSMKHHLISGNRSIGKSRSGTRTKIF